MKNKIVPEPGKLVVLPDEKKADVGGFTLPSSAKKDSKEGSVVWLPIIGHETLRVGDRVIFHSNSGVKKSLDDGNEYLILLNEEVFAKVP